MELLFVFSLFAAVLGLRAVDFCELTGCVSNSSNPARELHNLCQGVINGHCCMMNDTAVMYDYTDCSLKDLSLLRDLPKKQDIVMLLLDANPFLNYDMTDFRDYDNLILLTLPDTFHTCPSNSSFWNLSFNMTTPPALYCREEISYCLASQYPETICPSDSTCDPWGPGQFQCHCNGTAHGYKCMADGTFPTVGFSVGLAASTALVTASSWFLQRRHVHKVPYVEF